MTFLDRLALFSPLDGVAIGFLLAGWKAIGMAIERKGAARPSVAALMVIRRRE